MGKLYRADLTAHPVSGLQPEHLESQGYAGKNLVKLMFDVCADRGIDMCALVSQADHMLPGSLQDRFTYHLQEAFELEDHGYGLSNKGPAFFRVAKGKKSVTFVNAQSVVVMENGRKLAHTVIGSNKVPNLTLDETVGVSSLAGLILLAEHPFYQSPSPEGVSGIGKERFLRYKQSYDAIDWDAQLVIPNWIATPASLFNHPTVRALASHNKGINNQAERLAQELGYSLLAGSNAHRVEDIGTAYIEFDLDNFKTKIRNLRESNSSSANLKALKQIIRAREFSTVKKYQSLMGWLDWTRKFGPAHEAIKEREMREKEI